jgi:hypothetical protein
VDTPIPLQNISSAILGKVIEYCTQHKDDEPPPAEEYVVHSPATHRSRSHDVNQTPVAVWWVGCRWWWWVGGTVGNAGGDI